MLTPGQVSWQRGKPLTLSGRLPGVSAAGAAVLMLTYWYVQEQGAPLALYPASQVNCPCGRGPLTPFFPLSVQRTVSFCCRRAGERVGQTFKVLVYLGGVF